MSTISPTTFLANTSPEERLLLACARSTLDLRTVERIKLLLQQPLNWKSVFRHADDHGVMPLLCRSLNNFPQAVPQEILKQINSDFSVHARRNLLFTKELLRVLALMEQNEVRAVAYKGPVLAASAYGNVVLRTFVDLDILVHERDILRAKELLISANFRPLVELSKAEEEAHLKSRDEKDIVFAHPQLPIRIELHWRIASLLLFPLDSDLLWNRLGTIALGGAKISNLSAEDMLLILSVHGAKHSFSRFQWICDIAELIRTNPGMDWDHVMQQAHGLRVLRMVSLALALAVNLLDASIPSEVKQVVESDAKVRRLVSQVLRSLFRESATLSLSFIDTKFLGNLREKWADRTRLRMRHYIYNLNKAVTPNALDKKMLRLPAFLSVFYYIVRPIRLANIYGLELLMQSVKLRKR